MARASGHREIERRWAARPAVGRALQTLVVVAPITLAVVTGLATGQIFGRPESISVAVLRIVSTALVSMVVMAASERVFRRLLPLAAMYRLTLVFPDHAPSRFSVALRSGNTRKLQRQIEAVRDGRAPETGDQSYFETLLELTAALNRHDRLTRGHCERTRAYTEVIIRELELPAEDADRLRWASLLHDVGKLGVDARILTKPGKPTEAEWAQLRAHPEIGAKLVAPIAEFLGPWISAVDQHHERWDGGGYPYGLAGRDIHLGGRIVAVADAYDVMTSYRSYKRPMSPHDARKELVRCAGTQFDPDIVRAFLATSLGRARWSFASLGALVHVREAFALVSATPVAANVATAAGAVAMTTAAATGFGVVDELGSVRPFPSAAASVADEADADALDHDPSGAAGATPAPDRAGQETSGRAPSAAPERPAASAKGDKAKTDKAGDGQANEGKADKADKAEPKPHDADTDKTAKADKTEKAAKDEAKVTEDLEAGDSPEKTEKGAAEKPKSAGEPTTADGSKSGPAPDSKAARKGADKRAA